MNAHAIPVTKGKGFRIVMDPVTVPPELQALTQVEMLISAVMPMMYLYSLPLGQYGYSGHVVCLPQDMSSFVVRLPRLSSDVDIILVRKEGTSATYKDFRVRVQVSMWMTY